MWTDGLTEAKAEGLRWGRRLTPRLLSRGTAHLRYSRIAERVLDIYTCPF